MSARRYDRGFETAWHVSARGLYTGGMSVMAVTAKLNETWHVSSLQVRRYLRSQGVIRTHAEQQRLKRWERECVVCHQKFQGRTSTVIICDVCYGDDTSGMTPAKVKRYCQYMVPFLRKKNYGMDDAAFDALLNQQGGGCGLCGAPLMTPCVDHCHVTNIVRGLLCHRCNLTLGHVEKAGGSLWLEKAVAWLAKTRT